MKATYPLVALLVTAWPLKSGAQIGSEARLEPPPVAREFRAVWIATVSNIDWPSKQGLSTWDQQAELLSILNRAVALRLNAIILQVRPATDALYPSGIEPWSEYLTAEMGRPPEPPWDPVAFAVAEAHRRGLELHAWFNPYRAHHPSGKSAIAATHVSRTRPSLVRPYGRHLWLDPGDPAVRRYSVRVIMDVVRRYDVDGIHIDDYFYPYKERDSAGAIIDFPDDSSWSRYMKNGGTLSRDDWRRSNVNSFIRDLYRATKAAKPWVKLGISPFGVWRPGNPEQIKGFDAYAELYADSRLWLNNGWLDYFTPQLYWPIGRAEVSYPVLLKWWVSQNSRGRNMWPGNFTNRVGGTGPDGWKAQEILDQIQLTQSQPGATGNVHFSARSLMQDRDSLVERLANGPYRAQALVPASPWLDRTPPRAPRVRRVTDRATGTPVVELTPRGTEKTWLWVVRARRSTGWSTEILPGWMRSHMLTGPGVASQVGAAAAGEGEGEGEGKGKGKGKGKGVVESPDIILVSAVDRTGNESAATRVTSLSSLSSPSSRVPRN